MTKIGRKAEKKSKGHKKKRKIIIFSIFILLVLFAVIFFIIGQGGKDKQAAKNVSYYTVTTGRIENSIQGSSTLQAKDMYTITSSVKGEIWSDYFEDGDAVTEGDLLYHLEDTDYMSDLSDALEDIENAKEDLQDATDDLLEAQSNMQKKFITSPIDGVISALKIDEGDNVNTGAVVAEIFNNDTMLLTIPFHATDAKHIQKGDKAEVSLTSGGNLLSGTVCRVGTGALANSYGVPVTSVEIEVKNPGGITLSSTATAIVGTYACTESGSFSYGDTAKVKSEASGEVETLYVHLGDAVKKGDVIAVLDDDALSNALKNAQKAVDNAQKQADSAQERYDNLSEKITDYKIEAPITGTIISKSYKAGDKLDNTNGANTLAVIADLSQLQMEISVDELDIMSVKSKLDEYNAVNASKAEGEKPQRIEVRITADAVENKVFYGYVENVSIVGTSYTGSTSYPIYVVLENQEDSTEDINDYLIPGMNVTCEIMVESKSDVLLIPVSAIQRGNTVTRVVGSLPSQSTEKASEEADGTPQRRPRSDASGENAMPNFASDEMPVEMPPKKNASSSTTTLPQAQATAVETQTVTVTLGINDGTYVEVLSGLSAGDIIVLPDTTAAYSGSSEEDQMGFGMFGGGMPGGGMPGGGMPGGGMPGGMPGGNTGGNRGGMSGGNMGGNRGGTGGMR